MTAPGQGPVLFWRDEHASPTRRSRKTDRLVVTVAYLYVGKIGGEMASLTRSGSGKWYIAYSDLPGLNLSRIQGPLEQMREVVAADVARWLRRLTAPSLILQDGAGI